jgi:hypothetical protein
MHIASRRPTESCWRRLLTSNALASVPANKQMQELASGSTFQSTAATFGITKLLTPAALRTGKPLFSNPGCVSQSRFFVGGGSAPQDR